MIVATAGHIDHGKTALIKAITGVETTHLPEEKRRGLTIDLGFAAWSLGDGSTVGFVDVPGHERFVRNMLSGVTGIDFALLVVAADDGVMPQTSEHVEILDLLGIERGAVALTKIDRVPADRVAAVRANIDALLAATSLVGAPVFPVSALDGTGISALTAHLDSALAACPQRPDDGHFRLSIDRSFTVAGAGMVVTGTVAAGRVAVGDRLTLLPSGKAVRVRGLHGHHRAVAGARAGERCAINILAPDVDREQIGRGDWLTADAIAIAVARLDVRVRAPRDGTRLRQDTPVHLHHGAADVTGRLILLDGPALEPGGSALAQLALDRPVHALGGDRFVLRDRAATRTLAGGRVLDPFVPTRGRRLPARLAQLRALEAGDLAALLATTSDGIDLGQRAIAANLPAAEAAHRWTAAGLIKIADGDKTLGVAPTAWAAARAAVLAALDEFHRAHPDAIGPTAAQLRQARPPAIGRRSFGAALEALVAEAAIARWPAAAPPRAPSRAGRAGARRLAAHRALDRRPAAAGARGRAGGRARSGGGRTAAQPRGARRAGNPGRAQSVLSARRDRSVGRDRRGARRRGARRPIRRRALPRPLGARPQPDHRGAGIFRQGRLHAPHRPGPADRQAGRRAVRRAAASLEPTG